MRTQPEGEVGFRVTVLKFCTVGHHLSKLQLTEYVS